jgi:hypothetical protein
MMPMSDTLVESVYDIVNKQDGETDRAAVARAAHLAAQYRAQQLKQQHTQRAIERVAAERRALKESTGASRDMQQRTE